MTPEYLVQFTSRKEEAPTALLSATMPDSLSAWMARYLTLAIAGVRSEEVGRKIALHLARFQQCFLAAYGHERISTCLRRDVLAWQEALVGQGLAPPP